MAEEKAPSLFDFIDSINHHGQDLMTSEQNERAYDPFMVRRGLGMNRETLFVASRMNELHELDSYAQYQYLLNVVPKKKRYSKWAKKTAVSDDIKVISDYYQINMTTATKYRKLLTDEQVAELKERLTGGGSPETTKKKGRTK